ncbi:hypothetical protein FNV43_RR03370 [Rhamnella rubrinervis]|uniref:Protein MULTIPOLAR SPINDLE 1 n=1 Tax=Rhamnella rubrinervis TaxID=2594499 RepID=A0A8K0HHW2_9ROSA|nr:hypothetical protein FNV43_RR03370 [Rhamnella rubrinervis]
MSQPANAGTDEQSLKLAVVISLLRSKFLHKLPSFPSPSGSDALRWKRKARERKQEILRLREDLKQAEGASQCDLFPQSASCKCYFFDHLGKLSPKSLPDGFDRRFNDVLRRRFIRQVRLKERRKKTGVSVQRRQLSDFSDEDELEQLGASVDFIVEFCNTVSPVEANFVNWSHQAVDFILASLKSLLSLGKNMELIEGIVSNLITRLVKRMCSSINENESNDTNVDAQFYFQHLIRKLGSEPYVGQRAILLVSQRISILAESFLFTDPFDIAFPHMHECMFIMIQLIEFLVSDYFSMWSKDESFEKMLFEEWVTSTLHAKKAVELLESRNGLYALYMDRVTGSPNHHPLIKPCLVSLNFAHEDDLKPLSRFLGRHLQHQGRQSSDNDLSQTQKLRIYVRRRGGISSNRPRGKASSAIPTRLPSLHVGIFLCLSLSLGVFLLDV